MTGEEIKKKMDLLRDLWKEAADPREKQKIEQEARLLQCSHIEVIDGKTIHCKNPRRYEGSAVCKDHIWHHEKSADHKRKWTVKQIQDEMLSWRTNAPNNSTT